jgi:ATP-binding cassette subfamily F protein 3
MELETEEIQTIKDLEKEKKKIEEEKKIKIIKEILEQEIISCNLPEKHFEYLSNMLYEEPPRNKEDMYLTIKDFMENNPLMTQIQIKNTSQILVEKIKGIVDLKGRSWVAKKLEQPIMMENVQLISQGEEAAGYNEVPFDFKLLKLHNKIIDKNEEKEKIEKRKEKERAKIDYKINQTLKEIDKLSQRLPPVQVQHHRGGNYSLDIKVENFTLEVSGKVLIENQQLLLASGRKYGFIGQNGKGKTTLMYALARKEIKGMNKKPQILMIEQEVKGSDKTPLQIILETDGEREELLKKEKELLEKGNQEEELREVYTKLDDIEASKAEPKARTLLKGLGFTEEMIDGPSKLLSGGWRMRVALAKVLFCKPDILLLDEPTNHLDLDAVMWLQDYLSTFENTVVVVSHAREFLNDVCTDIIHLTNLKLDYYRGGFEEFETQRKANISRKIKEYESQQSKINHVKTFIDKFRYNAKRASMVQSRIKYLNNLEKVEMIVEEDPHYVFKFGTPDKVRPPVIRVDEGKFSYSSEKELLRDLSFVVTLKTRVALLGSNGVGKTTFLKILMGELKMNEGNYYINKTARISMFSQHHVEKLDLTLSPLEQLFKMYPDASSDIIRKHLAGFGISGDVSLRANYLLSGGQKSRVSLAIAAWNNPHILILDEPTNHLDMESVDALILALNNFTGGIIIVSHDQYFVSCVCDEIWYIRDHQLKKFYGDFDNYRKALSLDKL